MGILNGSTTNPVRKVQIPYSAAIMTTSVPDSSRLTAMTIELLGLDRFRGPLLSEAFRQIPEKPRSIRESHSVQKMRRL